MDSFSYHMPAAVVFGADALDRLPKLLAPYQRPAIVCGRASARRSGALDTVLARAPGAIVLDGVAENPETEACDQLASVCREARADVLVALGGGSVLDAAKAVALVAPNGGRCADYLDPHPDLINPLPLIAIPTTAGTGSEVTPYAVLVDSHARRKKTLKHPGLFPAAALLDPALTLSLPRDVTLAAGLDALSQGMEGFVSRRATPITDLLALDVCRRVAAALPVACAEPDNLGARGELLYAAMLSGVVIAQTGTTLVHGMGYYYTLEHGIAHGAANALLLPPVFQWNAEHLPGKVAALAEALGNPCASKPESAAKAIATALYRLYKTLEFAPAARDHGVSRNAAIQYAADIIQDPYRFKNQVGNPDKESVRWIFLASWAGESAS